MKLSNLMYLMYYIKTTDWNRLKSHRAYTIENSKISGHKLDLDMISCTLKYGLSFHEFYYYDLWKKSAELRSEYASMGFMYEFQKKFNPLDKRARLSNKNLFDVAYAEYLHRDMINPLTSSIDRIDGFIKDKKKVVLKKSTGGQGKFVKIIELEGKTGEWIKSYAEQLQFDILEDFVYQHDSLQKLSPNSLNTIRFITFLKKNGTVEIVGSSLRMGLDKKTDNLSSGGITCKVNVNTGIIESKGYSFDITKPLCDVHPISGVKLEGFQIPYWEDVKSMCIKAASKYDDNRCIGWDVAITNDGPLLIEGNHDWGARVWQMPAGKGMKKILESLTEE